MEQHYSYDAFISYRHLQLDKAVAKKLHTLIETYHIPAAVQKISGKKKMGKVFRDEEELPLATSLSENIKAALDASEWLIVVCTPALLESRWCMFEIDHFIELGRRDRILLVLADGKPETSFPKQLTSREEDGKIVAVEPLAANIVAEDTAKSLQLLKKEKLRILAPMLGVNFDDLKRRARQRKIRMIASVSAGVLAVGAALTVFLVVNHNRSEALKLEAAEQARIAEEARVRAEEEKARAEEEKARAEEEQRQKEIERRNAVNNDLGERMERANAALTERERREAASILLDSIAISEENENLRRDELIALLRKTMYIEPFSVIASFKNQNVRFNDITVSPDGIHGAGIVNGNSVAVIDLNGNEILYTVSVGNGSIIGLQFSADGSRFLVECDYGRLAVVWNTEDGSEAFRYVSKQNTEYHIANVFFWKDANTILVQDMKEFYLVSEDGSETLFYVLGEQMNGYVQANNLLTNLLGKPIEDTITVHNTDDYVGTQVLVSDDRSRVLVGGTDASTAVIILDDTGKRVSLLGVPRDPTCFMPGVFTEKWALSPDGKTAVCLSLIGIIGGWDTDTGNLTILDAFEYSEGFDFSEITFSPDSSRIAYTAENVLYVADARTGNLQLSANIDDTIFVPSLAFSADDNYLMMTNESMFIINAHNWNLELLENAEGGSNYNNIIPLRDTFLISRFDGTAYFYSMPSIASVGKTDTFDGALCEAPKQYIEGKSLNLKGEHKLSDGFLRTYMGTDTSPRMVLSRDQRTVALAYPDGIIELFDTDGDGTVRTMIGEMSSTIEALAMSENLLVASDQTTRLLLYDLERNAVRKIIRAEMVYSGFAFDPDGKHLMALTFDRNRIDVYDTESATLLFRMKSDSEFTDFAFSTDGAYAVGVEQDGGYVTGTLWLDENALLEQAKLLVNPKQ